MDSKIVVRGAREHNLRGVNLELPRNQLIVFTGVSGSGKSSLAFDTLYAEGQRRYVESLSSYARQFMGQMQKPDVDHVSGLSPSISIQQKSASRNPRSTVGTITEIHDYLRVLYARVGTGHCPACGRPIAAQTREQIIGRVLALPPGARFQVLAPVVRGQKGEYKDLFADMLKRGFLRARVDGRIVNLTDDLKLDRQIKHNVEIVVDRLKNEPKVRPRLAEAIEQALALGEGNLIIATESEGPRLDSAPELPEKPRGAKSSNARPGRASPPSGGRSAAGGDEAETSRTTVHGEDILISSHYACTHCDKSFEPPTPQLFSFNSPQGMCLDCDGLGVRHAFDEELLVPDPSLSFAAGAVQTVGKLKDMGRWRRHVFEGVAETLKIDLNAPWKKLPKQHRHWLLHGSGDVHVTFTWRHRGGTWKHGGKWEGIIPQLMASFKKVASGPRRAQLEKYMRSIRCPTCDGQRLNPQARAVRVGGKTLVETCAEPIGRLHAWFNPGPHPDSPAADEVAGGRQDSATPLLLQLDPIQRRVAAEVVKEIHGRLQFLLNVGLHYLTLDRAAPSLSGGEAQRIRLAGQIGCGLVGVLYVLDEPSIGLHPRDNDRLLRSLERLRDVGNTVVVVEHDEETIRAADYVVDFGPGPGVRGGEVVVAGTFEDVLRSKASLTGQYLAGVKSIPAPPRRRQPGKQRIQVLGATHNNLKNVDVDFPIGLFIAVTGVSGSGKSSLVNDILLNGLRRQLGGAVNGQEDEEEKEPDAERAVGKHKRLLGAKYVDKVIAIDQSPIGRTPRSNPATYVKVFDEIRQLFAKMPHAKVRGYKPGRFSFNVPGGRCEACQGNGANKLEMDFLADVWVPCPVCEGRRFNRETLQVHFKNKSIRDVLEMDVQEALELFADVPKIRDMLQTLHDVGLDYLKLGQASPTLSGGEAQRIKLAKELCRKSTGKTLYVLDEPTTGLHFEDVRKLLEVLHGFVAQGNTVVVIEHNLDVVKTADWIIDLGPEGGAEGGYLVCAGPPEAIAKHRDSFTGQALRPVLEGRPSARGKGKGAGAARNGARDSITHVTVKGAAQHNLKGVDVSIPRDAMTVCCGPSGSGKSSLAIDTVYAEGQRRYVESLSAYARQFLGQMQKPKVEHVSGLSPAISIEQKTTSKSPRSTVGTITEIHDYLRVLYARLGQPHCPKCQIAIGTQSADQIIDRILELPEGSKLYLMAPIERKGQEKYEVLWEEIRRAGYLRMRVDGASYAIDDPPAIDHRRKHAVEVVVDRVVVRGSQRGRLADAVEAALDLGKGVMTIAFVDDGQPETKWRVERFSQHLACPQCGRSFEALNPHHFSFNTPLGWCPTCEGLGHQMGASLAALIRDPRRTIRDGAIAAWPDLDDGPFVPFAEALAKHVGFSLDVPYGEIAPAHQAAILHGTGEDWIDLEPAPGDRVAPPPPRFQYKGLFPAIDEATRVSFVYRQRLDYLVTEVPCTSCHGSRLRDDAAAVRFAVGEQALTLGELGDMPLGQTLEFFKKLKLPKERQKLAGELLREIRNRLQFLVDVGLDYLTLNRPGPTLSGGEAQRIRLASQIGSGLTGVLYVLDEPTIGLHPRDNRRLIKALTNLRDLGNTLLLVEHDREVIATADYLLDFGPGAGENGGQVVAEGPPARVGKNKHSLTGRYLSGKQAIVIPRNRRIQGMAAAGAPQALRQLPANHPRLTVKGARQHNLKNVDVDFPLGCFIAVTGVSGSGKSSLIEEVLYNTLARRLHRARTALAAHDDIAGLERIDKVINVDQAPIGNTPSSNPATYTGVFDLIRQLFAQLPGAKVRGYHPRRFSFNKPGGRCEACEGNGQKRIEMHFLPDVWVECETCKGTRYNPETLLVTYKGHSIADVLTMSVARALDTFANVPKIRRVLQTLADVGLDYLSLGQAAPTLSGGEAQRVKLAAELARPNTGKTLYVLDEPTTGLHFDDVRKLLDVLNRLVDLGNTVIVVEHNLDVIKTADWLIDLGPEAGEAGGRVVACGTPEDLAAHAAQSSHTAAILAETLAAGPYGERGATRADEQQPAPDDVDLDDVGKDAKMPWETDGERWHVAERLTSNGKPVHWEGKALAWIVERIHALGSFAPTNWNHRTTVEITAPTKSKGWFFHGYTGSESVVWMSFRVAKNTFKRGELEAKLGIKPLDETPGVKGYGSWPRVRQRRARGPWDGVEIAVHWLSEIQTPAFDDFLRRAVASFQRVVQGSAQDVESHMPWRLHGERWHLSTKGFPPGRKLHWDPNLITRLLAVVKQVEPKVEVVWTTRDAIMIRHRKDGKTWARWRTKQPGGLDCLFVGKRAQFNLARLEPFGYYREVLTDKSYGDVIRIVFRSDEQIRPDQLKQLLREHLAGAREHWGE